MVFIALHVLWSRAGLVVVAVEEGGRSSQLGRASTFMLRLLSIIHLPYHCVSGSSLNLAASALNTEHSLRGIFAVCVDWILIIWIFLEPIVQFEETTMTPAVNARGQGAVAPPCMWVYRLRDKFSCRTMASYPTPIRNVQTAHFLPLNPLQDQKE